MKYLLTIVAILLILQGCANTDKVYNKAKGAYTKGKKVYKVLPVKSEKLEKVDSIANKYDETRTVIKGD